MFANRKSLNSIAVTAYGKPKATPTPKPAPANLIWHQLATRVQTKLTIGAPDNPYEREADQVADQVMRMPEPANHTSLQKMGAPAIQRKCACGGVTSGEEECEECGALHRKATSNEGGVAAPPIVDDVTRSRGVGLDAATRSFFEPRFGHDFGGVRVHADARAAESARAVGAKAYTSGPHIVFGAGQYSPESHAGRALIAHELAHTVQQEAGPPVVARQDNMDAGVPDVHDASLPGGVPMPSAP